MERLWCKGEGRRGQVEEGKRVLEKCRNEKSEEGGAEMRQKKNVV